VKALVTGGAGFIGSHVVDALLAEGAQVVVLDDLSTSTAENLPPGVPLVQGAVEDLDAVREAIIGCEVVMHLAAHRSVVRSVDNPLATNAANITGTLTVLAAAQEAGVRRVVNTSSSSVYGGAEEMPTPESAPLLPRSPYAVSKVAAEHYCRVYAELFTVETASLRPFNVYGPRQDPNSRYAAVIPMFLKALLDGEDPEIHGDGLQTRDFTFVADAAAAYLRAARAPASAAQGQAYNIAGGSPWNLLQLLEYLSQLTGRSYRAHHVGPRAGDVRHTWADTGAARANLQHCPSVSMEEGLAATVEWFLASPALLAESLTS
jgi:UDP-glucose 4-epimerase